MVINYPSCNGELRGSRIGLRISGVNRAACEQIWYARDFLRLRVSAAMMGAN